MEADELADLIERAQRRDPSAFDRLVDAYSSRLYGYFYRLSGSHEDAEDLLQELFVRLVRMIEQYQHEGRFEPWLFRIAANLARDRVRRHKAAKQAGLGPTGQTNDEGAEPVLRLVDQGGEPSHRLETSEQADRLQQAIAQLPEAEREVICLRHFSELPFRDIAELMGTPLGTSLARAHRGLARLRELLEPAQAG
jgi:RNA polymerase sigma-70 factor (ECF subfamily)